MSIRTFDTGATRDTDENKLDFDGFLSPLALERYAQYMHKHRKQSDGGMRDSDNWQKGIPLDAYMKSGWRHFRDWWREHRGYDTDDGIEESLCALIFNAMGYLHVLESRKEALRQLTKEAQEQGFYDDVAIQPPPHYNPEDVAFRASTAEFHLTQDGQFAMPIWHGDPKTMRDSKFTYDVTWDAKRSSGVHADSVDIARGPLAGPEDRL